MPTSLGNINLFVKDVNRAQQFYTDIIGLSVNNERSAPPSFILLQAGSCTLTLQDGSTPGAILSPADSVEIGFAVDDVEVVRERLKNYGMEVGEVQ